MVDKKLFGTRIDPELQKELKIVTARMEESETAASCYDRVYVSPRPELFMKATPHRVAGPGQPVRIRLDAKWGKMSVAEG